jgi:hypothetical protein
VSTSLSLNTSDRSIQSLIDWITTMPFAGLTALVLVIIIVFAVVTIYLVAFFQGRELSFWPLRIGPRPVPSAMRLPASKSTGSNDAECDTDYAARLCGTYEWQWAGENWYGRLRLAKHNDALVIDRANVGRLRKTYRAGRFRSFEMTDTVLTLNHGTVHISDPDTIQLTLSVQKRVAGLPGFVPQTITGELHRTPCFAGRVQYRDPNTGNANVGDMILVSYQCLIADI